MSIRDAIADLENKELWRFAPPDVPHKRRLYLTKRARHDLVDKNSAINLLGSRGFVQAALVRWVSGARVHVDEKGKARFLKRLDPPPPEIWEVRVTDPRPQIRLFGRFADPDTLILTKFHTRSYLGDRDAPGNEWPNAMSACETAWTALFTSEQPFSANTIHAYVTENCDDYRI